MICFAFGAYGDESLTPATIVLKPEFSSLFLDSNFRIIFLNHLVLMPNERICKGNVASFDYAVGTL